MKDFLLTTGGFIIGVLIGGIILYFVLKNARKQFQDMAEADENEWEAHEKEAKEK